MATVKRSVPDPDFVKRLAEEYAKAKEFAEKATKHSDSLKKQLIELVESQGDQDDKGNLWMSAGPYDLKRERRVSRNLDTDEAATWARENNLWNEVRQVVETVSEEALLGLAWERQELAPTISSFYKEKEIWAFRLIEKKEDNGDTAFQD